MPNIQAKSWYQNKPIETKQTKPMSNSKQIQRSMMEFKRRLIKKKDLKLWARHHYWKFVCIPLKNLKAPSKVCLFIIYFFFPYDKGGFHKDIALAYQRHKPPKKHQMVMMGAHYALSYSWERKGRKYSYKRWATVPIVVGWHVHQCLRNLLDFIHANQENLRSEHYKGI